MELLRLLARQRLLKVGEKGIMTIGTKEAVEREANNLALLLQKYKLDPAAFNDIGSLRRTIRGLEELDFANVLKEKAPPPDNIIEGKFGKPFTEEKEFLESSMKKNIDEATEKGDFKGIFNQVMRDPEIAEEFKKMKAAQALADERALQTKPIPLDTIQYQGKEIQKMTGPEKQKYLITDDKQTAELLKKGYTFDDIIYAQDNYGLTAKEIMQEAKGATKKDPFPFASGGRAELKGGGDALKALIRFLSAQSGKTGSQGLADINPKKFGEALNFMIGKEQMAVLQGYRKEYLESLLDTIKSDKKLLDDIKTKYPEDIQPMIYKMANEGGNKGRLDVYKKVDIDEAIADIETMVKNMEVASGRKLNSDGGRIGLKEGYRPGAPIDPLDPQRKISEVMDAYDKYYEGPGKKVRKIPFIKFFEIYAKENFADGGRVGLKVGSMSKRAFLKMLAALGITGAAAKSGILSLGGKQTGKQVVKEVVKTANVAGKPEWFDSLVSKVILEGDDVTKNFATKERQIVHTKKIDEDNTVRVTQDLDEGSIKVEYDSDTNVFGDTVELKYKKPPPDEGDPRPSAEFTTSESGPVGRAQGPDDYDIEIDEVGGNSIEDLNSDVSKLKEFATGKKPTIKEMMQIKKRKDKAADISDDVDSAQMNEVIKRQGDYVDDDFSPDYASGGIAKMLGE